MIELFLNTGEYFTGEHYHQDGNVYNGVGFIQSQETMNLQVMLNGKTLHETYPVLTHVGGKTFVDNTGEFFLSGFQLLNSTGETYELINNSVLQYNWVSDRSRFFSTGDIVSDEFYNDIDGFYSGQHIFANGVKLVSGDDYSQGLSNAWSIEDMDENISGIMFTQENLNDFYLSGSYDILGTRFNRGGFTAYLNGIHLDEECFLQLGSVVTNIETGLEPCVEFNFPQKQEIFYL